jgi:hypothetical protein
MLDASSRIAALDAQCYTRVISVDMEIEVQPVTPGREHVAAAVWLHLEYGGT